MADGGPAESLRDEASCPVCRGLFQDPVSIHCGHNFCRGCISRCWGDAQGSFSCPRCQEAAPERSLRPNRELAKIIAIAQRLSLRAGRDGQGAQSLCQKHGEALKLFCEEDETPICLVCRESQAHRAHAVVPIEEAAEEDKEKLLVHVQILRDRREKLLELKAAEEEKSLELLERVSRERQRVVSGARELRRLLAARERRLLGRLARLERRLGRRRHRETRRLCGRLGALGERIRQLEAKSRQPPCELLRDSRTILRRLEQEDAQEEPEDAQEEPKDAQEEPKDAQEEPGEPGEEPGEEPDAAAAASQEIVALRELLMGCRVHLTLDPATAHPRLSLSPDLRGVRWGETRLARPDTPQRFDSSRCVLGREPLGPGRHYWEVVVGPGGGAWALGVARESVRRKGRLSVSPAAGVWALGRCGSRCQALGCPDRPLLPGPPPSVIGVYLDYEAGRVGFYDPRGPEPIFTHPPAAFRGERLLPLLCLGRGCRFTLAP